MRFRISEYLQFKVGSLLYGLDEVKLGAIRHLVEEDGAGPDGSRRFRVALRPAGFFPAEVVGFDGIPDPWLRKHMTPLDPPVEDVQPPAPPSAVLKQPPPAPPPAPASPPPPPAPSGEVELRAQKIREVVASLLDDAFSAGGRPKVRAVELAAGFETTREEIDEALAKQE